MTAPLTRPTSAAPPHKPLSRAYALAIGLYVFIAPIYVLASGNPQPGDIVLTLIMWPTFAWALLNFPARITSVFLTGLAFVLLAIAVNVLHYSFLPHKKFLMSGLYYAYNFAIFLFIAFLFKNYGEQLRRITYVAVLGAIALQCIWIAFFPFEGLRATGTMNNPNQFAYWSLLSLIMITLLRRGQKFTWLDYGAIAALFYCEMLALSKAGLITYALALVVLPFMKQFTRTGLYLLVGAVMVLIPVMILQSSGAGSEGLQNRDPISRAVARLQDIGRDADDTLKGRAYNRLLDYPEYLLLGAGEGAYERFDPARPIEIHSGIATLFFSYGVLGAGLFFAFLLLILRGQPWPYWALIGCIMLYGLTHQNMRFTHFWIVLGLLHGTRGVVQMEKRTSQKRPPLGTLG